MISRITAKKLSRPTNSRTRIKRGSSPLVGEGGFEPPKPKQQIYSLPHLTALELPHIKSLHNFIQAYCKAGGQTRTPDLLITNQLLYQLSYTSL